MSAALDGGTEVMVFVYSFAVGCFISAAPALD